MNLMNSNFEKERLQDLCSKLEKENGLLENRYKRLADEFGDKDAQIQRLREERERLIEENEALKNKVHELEIRMEFLEKN